MSIYHVTVSAEGRQTIATDPARVLSIARVLTRFSGERLSLFSIVDDHVHNTARVSGPPQLFARGLRTILSSVIDVDLDRPNIRPIKSRTHMQNLVGYLLRQPRKHGLRDHPALWPGSCFPDLLGARLLRGFTPHSLARELPRYRAQSLLRHVGLPGAQLSPASDAALQDAGLARLVSLASAVHGHPAPLNDLTPDSLAIRSLATRAAMLVGYPTIQIAAALGISDRAVRRAAKRNLHPLAMIALRRRLTLENLVLNQRRRAG